MKTSSRTGLVAGNPLFGDVESGNAKYNGAPDMSPYAYQSGNTRRLANKGKFFFSLKVFAALAVLAVVTVLGLQWIYDSDSSDSVGGFNEITEAPTFEGGGNVPTSLAMPTDAPTFNGMNATAAPPTAPTPITTAAPTSLLLVELGPDDVTITDDDRPVEDFNIPYENNINRAWIFTAIQGQFAVVDFEIVDVEGSNHDFVTVTDNNGNELAMLNSERALTDFRVGSPTNQIRVEFKTDTSVSRRGFIARLSSSLTAAPTPFPTTAAPTSEPTTPFPTSEPTRLESLECAKIFPDVVNGPIGTGTLRDFLPDGSSISQVLHAGFGPETTSISGILRTFEDENPFGLPTGTVDFKYNPSGSITMEAAITDADFFIRRAGALYASVQLRALDPEEGFFEAESQTDGSMLIVADKFAYSFASGTAERCTAPTDPGCAGPFYMMAWVEVCSVELGGRSRSPTVPPVSGSSTQQPTSAPTNVGNAITVVFTNDDISDQVRQAFMAAEATWNSIITNTLPDIALPSSITQANQVGCSVENGIFPNSNAIEGIVIFATIAPIDGFGLQVGRAGPCLFGDSQGSVVFGAKQPRVGQMTFDSADMDIMANGGNLKAVVLHEMAHVLGIGTTWSRYDVLQGAGSNEPRFTGANGIEGYREVGGQANSIPVANVGGPESREGHWRESTFRDELMTPNVSGANTLSVMTIKSLRDLGYTADPSLAEPYMMPSGNVNEDELLSKDANKGHELMNDILHFKNVGIISNDGKLQVVPSAFLGPAHDLVF